MTIIGGFLLALWLIEGARISRETERKKRVKLILKSFKNFLLPWLFQYATTLSTNYELYHHSMDRIGTGKYRDDIPQLEDIFGIGEFDKTGKRLRGTDTFNQEEFLKIPHSAGDLYHSLNYGLREIEQIEGRIREFPIILEEIDPEVAKIVHLTEYIHSRIAELQEWERKYGEKYHNIIDGNLSNLAMLSNLRSAGKLVLNVVIAIDKNIDRLEAEL